MANNNSTRRLRNWCFTLNNPADTNQLDTWGKTVYTTGNARYLIFQLERGESGTMHLQGYIEFSDSRRFSAVRRLLPGAHIEPRRGSAQQAADYCRKHDSRVDGPWEFGEVSISAQGKRSDLCAVAEAVKSGQGLQKICEEHTSTYIRYHRGIREAMLIAQAKRPSGMRNKVVVLIYGASGIGKTSWVLDRYDATSFVKEGNHKWFDGYVEQDTVLIDDFAGGKSGFTCSATLNLFDKRDCRVEVKGGFAMLSHNTLFVTSNIHPRDWWEFTDREMHYTALKNRFTQVWTMENYKPVVLDKNKFFEEFSGYRDYPVSQFSVTCVKPRDHDQREGGEEEMEEMEESCSRNDTTSSSCTTTVEFSQ